MRKHDQRCRLSISERLYAGLVWFYPKPFRDTFGSSMKQVFRDQCSDTINKNGWYGLIALWIRVLLDFAWTCPKEHLIALPTLPSRMWEDLLRKPVWFHPTLIASLAFGLSVYVTLRLPQFYASTVTLEITLPEPTNKGITAAFGGGYFIQTELEKLASKTVLYPVITNLALCGYYGQKSPAANDPPPTSCPCGTPINFSSAICR